MTLRKMISNFEASFCCYSELLSLVFSNIWVKLSLPLLTIFIRKQYLAVICSKSSIFFFRASIYSYLSITLYLSIVLQIDFIFVFNNSSSIICTSCLYLEYFKIISHLPSFLIYFHKKGFCCQMSINVWCCLDVLHLAWLQQISPQPQK